MKGGQVYGRARADVVLRSVQGSCGFVPSATRICLAALRMTMAVYTVIRMVFYDRLT